MRDLDDTSCHCEERSDAAIPRVHPGDRHASLAMTVAGFTMVEIVLAIALMAILFPFLMSMFAETTVNTARAHITPTASALATELMEEIKSRKFDELAAKDANGNWSAPLGVDAGEAANDKNTFDDVDDFNGWNQNFGPNFTSYTATVSVSYVASNNLNAPLVIPGAVPNNWTPSYKRIVVTVSNAGLAANMQLVTIVTEYQSL